MQIMIAKHRDRARTQFFDEAQHGERLRTPVHEIADQPQTVAPGIESNFVEQPSQRRIAALDIADRVRCHYRSRNALSSSSLAVSARATRAAVSLAAFSISPAVTLSRVSPRVRI